jgi:multidrug efflux pump subunit AcrB
LIGYQDGDIYVSLKSNHRPTANYVRQLRERLPAAFPGTTFSFLPADIVSQILNFGSPAPIDLQVVGPNQQADQTYALALLQRMRSIRGIADARMQQSVDNPQLRVDVDRSRMAQLGLTELDVTNAVATSLAGSSQTAPTYWLDPQNGVSYPIVAQTPEYQVDTLSNLDNLPVTGAPSGLQVLGGLGKITREQSSAVVTHYNIEPAIDLFAATQDRDLGGVASDVQR